MEQISIAELVAWIESRDDSAAVRFEPATYNKIANGMANAPKAVMLILENIKAANRCNLHTAAMIYSTSWGKYQSMGFNVYANATDVSIAEYLASPRLQHAQFVAFLKRNGLQDFTPVNLARDQNLRLKFSMKYNGSIAYEAAMLDAIRHFGLIPVTLSDRVPVLPPPY